MDLKIAYLTYGVLLKDIFPALSHFLHLVLDGVDRDVALSQRKSELVAKGVGLSSLETLVPNSFEVWTILDASCGLPYFIPILLLNMPNRLLNS